ncbi:coiled-coil domain-containing protein 17 [Pangasianodon hypophthalmus]|uniref:coiled-coil domain-containing protein 17 n=1 Tax=Pangasianodon hypophthalmus TaxID=310915 RepID=UPI0023074684|nr:coiled-coil domain-containing protein 17 [Pangasianodon hypophthalmus]
MEHSGEFSCPDCNMAFRSFDLLDKHKSRFCIGSAIGDPTVLRRGRVEISEPEKVDLRALRPRKTKTPDLIHLSEQRDKLLRQTERRETHREPSVADSLAFNRLTHEFHKLRMSIEESLPRRHTEGMYPGRKWADGKRLQEVCEHHEQKLAEIRAHTTELEQQRKEIERQMALVGNDGTVHLKEMLHELKEQEERNEEVLYRLSTQINALHGVKDADVASDQLEDRKTRHFTFDLISAVDGLLSSQIRALHLAYIQSGGSDPEVLAHLHDLQAEAHSLEQSRPAAEHRTRKKRRMKSSHAALGSSIMVMENENQQLEEQILKLQIDRERRRGRAAGSELDLIQRHHIHQVASLQAEISNLRREVEKSRGRKTHPPAPEYSSQQHSLMDRHVIDSVDSLGPAPYDPASGFVIFYDLVLGVDATFRTVLLVARLYSGGQEIGRPTPMPPVHCQPAGALGYPLRRHAGNYALLAVKQPVHRVQPSPSLYLVVEVQVVGGFDLCDQEMGGWSKLQLFDSHNQVQSGFWKLPFRSLPVRPSLSPGQLNSVPQLGNMEICLRIVNARDEDVQSLAKIDPNNSRQYKYPSVVTSHSNTDLEEQTSQPKTLQLSLNPFLSSLAQTDHVDPPPKDSGQR